MKFLYNGFIIDKIFFASSLLLFAMTIWSFPMDLPPNNLQTLNSPWSVNSNQVPYHFNALDRSGPSNPETRNQASIGHASGQVHMPSYQEAYYGGHEAHPHVHPSLYQNKELHTPLTQIQTPYTGDGTEYLDLPVEDEILLQSTSDPYSGNHQTIQCEQDLGSSMGEKGKAIKISKGRKYTLKGDWRDHFPRQLKTIIHEVRKRTPYAESTLYGRLERAGTFEIGQKLLSGDDTKIREAIRLLGLKDARGSTKRSKLLGNRCNEITNRYSDRLGLDRLDGRTILNYWIDEDIAAALLNDATFENGVAMIERRRANRKRPGKLGKKTNDASISSINDKEDTAPHSDNSNEFDVAPFLNNIK